MGRERERGKGDKIEENARERGEDGMGEGERKGR